MKKALVCGAGGFVGHHMVRRLKAEGYRVYGVDLNRPEFGPSEADKFVIADLREHDVCESVFTEYGEFNEIYQFAADTGGIRFVNGREPEVLHNNELIACNVIHACGKLQPQATYFFPSSASVYRDTAPGEPALREEDAYPAQPYDAFGWEKLCAESILGSCARFYELEVRVARFDSCYGPEVAFAGGRERAAAAICRKVAEVKDGESISIWGDGKAVRNFVYVDDLVDGIRWLMAADFMGSAVNIGTEEYATVNDLVQVVLEVANKKRVQIQYAEGPVGAYCRKLDNARIRSTGWTPAHTLKEGMEKTYPWVAAQVRKGKSAGGKKG
jgi:GDP-D-mannose 3',5'-epimerase